MPSILDRLDARLRTITEDMGDTSWKSPLNPNYDRQWAEDALYHTIGPLTDTPRWSGKWTSKSEPVPGFTPNSPAPQWTPEEVVFAMAGDPQLVLKPGAKDNPRSPAYGHQGGSPVWRTARRVAKFYARDRDPSFISDMYSNGMIPLVRMMQPGFDEGRSPFISYSIRQIQSAMEHGVGGTGEAIRAKGGDSTTGASGLQSLLAAKTPEEARKIASQIKGKYQTAKSHDRHPDNPFGPFSSRVFQVANQYADALAAGDESSLERARNQVAQLIEAIEETETFIPGASTGMGQAISTPDRKTSIGVASMDVNAGDEQGSMAGNIAGDDGEDSWIDPETVHYVLDIALAHDITKLIANDPNLQKLAADMGIGAADKVGSITANEFRYILRQMGPLAANYPGKGRMRTNLQTPRDAVRWLKAGEDPEIEPIPSGGIWHSIWSRGNFEAMGPTAIAQEMTQEVKEFEKLGIPTARKVKVKGANEEAISKVAVATAVKNAMIKLKLVAAAFRSETGMGESKKTNSSILTETYDAIDTRIIMETFDWMIRKISRMAVDEETVSSHEIVENKPIIRWSI